MAEVSKQVKKIISDVPRGYEDAIAMWPQGAASAAAVRQREDT